MTTASASVRKIVYLSGTRADFGLMQSTLLALAKVADVSILVTGMHLQAAFGATLSAVLATGLRVCGKVPMDVTTRSKASMARGVGQCMMGVTDCLAAEKPDLLLVMGDRGEMLAGALAALHLGIVCVHVHGGERSGTVDEPVRHAISKLSTYHLVATEQSKSRLIRMGEDPSRIEVTGAPGLDGLHAVVLPADQLKQTIGLPDNRPFLLALFHPVVQQADEAYEQTVSVLRALKSVDLPVLWLDPNADAGSGEVLRALDAVSLPGESHRARHLDRSIFCSAMQHCSVMVGNSSAGIIEAATFGTPVVNVGDRQRLRERNDNVTDVAAEAGAILVAIRAALTTGRLPTANRYGDGLAGPRIVECLIRLPIGSVVLEKVNSY